ncbi:sporulation peptidase YabG [Paenibacillus turpanensis]|uniref:sporulation peptidase YabG n=1 Tax=Paenibacillus turpanensis TaxID=2689078 RepID=UPI00140B8A1B|nr:sporulation peptidase YabG [Paenibacillus turpanensis]
MKTGDYVTRKSYGNDLLFRLLAVEGDRAIICGVDYRLLADAPLEDLEPFQDDTDRWDRGASEKLLRSSEQIRQCRRLLQQNLDKEIIRKANGGQPYFEVPGTVLHLDGDAHYLQKSLKLYREMQVPAEGRHVAESEIPEALRHLLPRVKPDVVVVTGHDSFRKQGDGNRLNIDNYKNSRHFVQAVRIARNYERNRDALTIIAGACQSHFEALLQAGANFASSPNRVLIHALDPVFIAIKSAYTPIKDTVNIYDVVQHTVSGFQGLGGIETRGSYRIGMPKVPLNK